MAQNVIGDIDRVAGQAQVRAQPVERRRDERIHDAHRGGGLQPPSQFQ